MHRRVHGGRLALNPWKDARTASIFAANSHRPAARGSRRSRCRPSAFPLPVAMSRRYALRESMRKRENLVASPNTSGRRPVANGSSVPVWPPFREPSRRFALASARVEVMPAGLSSSRTPSGPVGAVRPPASPAGPGARRAGGVGLTASSMRRESRAPRSTDSSYSKCSSGTERVLRRCARLERRNPAARCRPSRASWATDSAPRTVKKTLACDWSRETSDAGERHHAHARIAQLEADDLRQLALDLVGDAGAAGSGHCRLRRACARPRPPRTPRAGHRPARR